MHEAEISVAVIPVQERNEVVVSKSRKHKRESEYLQAGVKYHKIYHTKRAMFDNEVETILPGKELEHKRKKRMISKLIPDLLLFPTHLCGILAPKRLSKKIEVKRITYFKCMVTFICTKLG